MPRWLPAAAFLAALAPLLAAEEKSPDPKLEPIRKDLYFLAGDECEGRGLKTKGILKAGDYIAKTFADAGLKPAGENGGFFQPFKVVGRSSLGTPMSLTLKGAAETDLKYKTDFVATQGSGNGKFAAPLAFAGYGITRPGKDGYDDYAGLDVKGKIVVVLRRMPKADDANPPFEEDAATFKVKVENALAHKAVGVLFVSDRGKAGKTDDLIETAGAIGAEMPGPVFHVKRAAVEALLKEAGKPTLTAIEEGIDKDFKPNGFDLTGLTAGGEVTINRTVFETKNVVAVCEGSGPLADETVVIGAHYDHIGHGDEGSSLERNSQGKTHYGADDNASGTSGLLELARRYGAMKDRVGRRIVFVAFSGEEKGLFGSLHYVKAPAFPLEKTVFMINMDMIGRVAQVEEKDKPDVKLDRLVVYGTGTEAGLDALAEKVNKDFNFKMMKVPGGQGPSDHTSFYNKKIPVLFLFSGTHKDYHRPSDTPDKINYAGLRKTVDFAEVFAKHYTTVPAAEIVYKKTKGGGEDPTDTSPRRTAGNAPRIGIMPGNYGEEDAGVLVGGVTPDGPADKGGVKENDLIVEMAGKPVKNMTNYMDVMAGQKAGTEMEIVVVRDKKKVTLKIVPAAPR